MTGLPKRIAMWSGPRNISTAMMRSFGAREDCAVVDEPFYGAFLKQSRAPHPMADEIIADMDCDWWSVMRRLAGAHPKARPLWYQKHMPHLMTGPVSISDFEGFSHAFLIRSPEKVIASYAAKNELSSKDALGYAKMRSYFEVEQERSGQTPAVLDCDDILRDPQAGLKRLCTVLEIDWDPAMLEWEAGPHDSDGIWGRHWYDAVNASRGFLRPAQDSLEHQAEEPAALSGGFAELAKACRDDYEALKQYAL